MTSPSWLPVRPPVSSFTRKRTPAVPPDGPQAGGTSVDQKGVEIKVDIVPGANHFFTEHLEQLMERVSAYLDDSLPKEPAPALF